MALWGKGDPRWIVEERPDSTNVNNWHWTERDATNWSKVKLKEMFLELKEETEEGCWRVDEVKTIDGEATINNRKGKLIYFYEWDITLCYKGKITGSELEHSGTINIPNLSDENSADDIDVEIRGKGDSKNSEKLKQIVRKNGIKMCREKCQKYINDIHMEYSTGMVLPTKEEQKKNNININTSKNGTTANRDFNIQNLSVADSKPVKQNVSVNTAVPVTLSEEFKTTADQLYLVFIQADRLSAFTRSQCISNAIPGGEFSIMNGNICGSYVKLVPNTEIVQNWRMKGWPDGVFSTVTMKLEQKSENTILKLTQTGIPDYDVTRIKEGWLKHFWGPIKTTFGFGAQLF